MSEYCMMPFAFVTKPILCLKRLLILLTICVIVYKHGLSKSQATNEEECLAPNPFSSETYDLRRRVASADYWHLRFDIRQLLDAMPLTKDKNIQKTDKLARAINVGGFVDLYLSVCHPLTNLSHKGLDLGCEKWMDDHTQKHEIKIGQYEEKPSCLDFTTTTECSERSAVCGIVTTYEKFQVNFGNYLEFENKIGATYFPDPLMKKDEASSTLPTMIQFDRPKDEKAKTVEYSIPEAVGTWVPTLPKVTGMELAVQYRNGSKCGNTSFSSYVTFKCSEREVLILSPIMHKCNLRFELLTRDACSAAKKSLDACLLYNRETGQTIDLTSLWNPNGIHIAPQGDQRLIFSVCGFLRKDLCGGFIGTTACIFNGKEVMVIGKKDGPLFRETNGSYVIKKEEGQDCLIPRLQFSMSIRFLCNANKRNYIPSTVIFKNSTCSFFVDWHTNLVCEPERKCSLRIGNGFYDLNRLKSKKVTQVKRKIDESVIFLSVCKALDNEYGCPNGGGTCIISNIRNISLGQPRTDLFIDENGNPSLHYENGSPCSFDTERKFSSRIHFHCMTHQEKEIIEEQGGTNNCTINFDWWTSEACLQTDIEGNCSFFDETSKTILSFSSLDKPSGYALQDAISNKTILINICNPLLNSYTDSKRFGAVELSYDGTPHLTYAGLSSSHIYLQNGLPTLKYIGSTPDKKQDMITLISFICTAKGVKDQFYKMSYIDDTYRVIWYTELACLPKHECSIGTADGITYSFQELRRPLGKYNISASLESTEHTILFNLCQPLSPTVNCTLGSAICLINKKTNLSIDLGYFGDPLEGSNTNDQPLKLHYTNGSLCNQETGLRFSATIVLKCGYKEVTPSFKKLGECQFELEWQTQYACPQEETSVNVLGNLSKRSDPEYKPVFGDIAVKDHIEKRSGEAEMSTLHIDLNDRDSAIDNDKIPTPQDVNTSHITNTISGAKANEDKTLATDAPTSKVNATSSNNTVTTVENKDENVQVKNLSKSVENNDAIIIPISPLILDQVEHGTTEEDKSISVDDVTTSMSPITTTKVNQVEIRIPVGNASIMEPTSILQEAQIDLTPETNISNSKGGDASASTIVPPETNISISVLNDTSRVKLEPDNIFTTLEDISLATNTGLTPIDRTPTNIEVAQGHLTENTKGNNTLGPEIKSSTVESPYNLPTLITKENVDMSNDADEDQSLLTNVVTDVTSFERNESVGNIIGSDSQPSVDVNNPEVSDNKSINELIKKENTSGEHSNETFIPITATKSKTIEFTPVESHTEYEFPVWASTLIAALLLILLIVVIAFGVAFLKRGKRGKPSMYPRFASENSSSCCSFKHCPKRRKNMC